MATMRQETAEHNRLFYATEVSYARQVWNTFDYTILKPIMRLNRPGRGEHKSVNDIIIMADTETSKKRVNSIDKDGKYIPVENHIVLWTVSIRAHGFNIATLYGRYPSDFPKCINRIHEAMSADTTMIFFHNLAYDWVFLRRFVFEAWSYPTQQLNTKSHNPINIEFENGIIFRDSLILAQRSLDRWAKDMNVLHNKAKGLWDYDKIRNQWTPLTDDELTYAEYDTLAGVECIDALMRGLGKNLSTIAYTATGIPREQARKKAKAEKYHDVFLRHALDFNQYIIGTNTYHGGYTHSNRHLLGFVIRDKLTQCYDFASSYPYAFLAFKYPSENFTPIHCDSVQDILDLADDYAFMFKLTLLNPRLKNDDIAMPALQSSKMTSSVNAHIDNGRVLEAAYVEIYLTEYDLMVINDQYDWDMALVSDCYKSHKDYLPRWFTDYVYQCFVDKTNLKGGDKVLYAIAKAKLNSLYGMCCQKCIQQMLNENYETGEYYEDTEDPEELYNKYLKKHNSVLPYQWGIWCTAIAFYNLHKLGKCCGTWIYSDTDSCYANDWDIDKVNAYNEGCKEKLLANGYGAVEHNGREYWLGLAEHEEGADDYTEFVTLGAKRYCGRNVSDGQLHITVAGVPKVGASELKDNINNFQEGFIFKGENTGKRTHTYLYNDGIYIDDNGNETGDSIDLTPCDYLLDSAFTYNWNALTEEPIAIQIYDEKITENLKRSV